MSLRPPLAFNPRPRRLSTPTDAFQLHPDIQSDAKAEWRKNVLDDVDVSRLHLSASATLAELRVQHEIEVLTDDELFSLDVYLPEHDVVLEVDGPSHYVGGGPGDHGPGERRRSPSTELRRVRIHTGSHTTASAWWTPILKDFTSRRISAPRVPRFQSRHTSTPFNSASDAFQLHPDVRSYGTTLRDAFLSRRHRGLACVPFFEWEALEGRAQRRAYLAGKLRAAGVDLDPSLGASYPEEARRDA